MNIQKLESAVRDAVRQFCDGAEESSDPESWNLRRTLPSTLISAVVAAVKPLVNQPEACVAPEEFAVYPTGNDVPAGIRNFQPDVFEAGGVVSGVGDLLAGRAKLATWAIVRHEPGAAFVPHELVTVGIGRDSYGRALRYVGEGFDPNGPDSQSVVIGGIAVSLDHALLAATMTAVLAAKAARIERGAFVRAIPPPEIRKTSNRGPEPVNAAVADDFEVLLGRTAPAFQSAVKRIAEVAGRSSEDVFGLWQKYSRQCDNGGQSALLSEFVQWYGADLGGNEAALAEAAVMERGKTRRMRR